MEEEITILCRICLDEDEKENLIYPCKCTGTRKYVHKRCLNEWRASNVNKDNFERCEICHYKYVSKVTTQENKFTEFCREITNCQIFFYLANYLAIIGLSYVLINLDKKLYLTKVYNNKNVYLAVSSLIVLVFQVSTIIYWFIKVKNKKLYCSLYVRNKSFIIWGILLIIFFIFFDWILTIILAQVICLNLYQKHFVINDNIKKLNSLDIENYTIENEEVTTPILDSI